MREIISATKSEKPCKQSIYHIQWLANEVLKREMRLLSKSKSKFWEEKEELPHHLHLHLLDHITLHRTEFSSSGLIKLQLTKKLINTQQKPASSKDVLLLVKLITYPNRLLEFAGIYA